MNREVSLPRVLLLVAILAGAVYCAYQFFWVPWQEYETSITQLSKKIEAKSATLLKIKRDAPKLEHLRLLSLPSDTNLLTAKPVISAHERDDALSRTQDRYTAYLRDLLRKSGFETNQVKKNAPDNKAAPALPGGTLPAYTSLSFHVEGKAKLPNLVNLLLELQRTPLLHRLKTINLRREGDPAKDPKKAEMIVVNLTIEALLLNSPSRRPTSLVGIDHRLAVLDAVSVLRRAPAGIALIPWAIGPTGPRAQKMLAESSQSRNLADIAKRNIFLGGKPEKIVYIDPPPEKKSEKERTARPLEDLITYTRITGISQLEQSRAKASLWDPSRDWWDTVQEVTDYNWIPLVKDGDQDVIVFGQVTQIVVTRYLVFKVQLRARDPGTGSAKRYPSDKVIYRAHKEDVDRLVKDKVARSEEADRLYWVSKKYWDGLKRDKVVRVTGSDFALRWDLVRGKIVQSTDKHVVLRLDEKYSGFRDDERSIRVTPHLGFCYLYNGNKLIEGLQHPVPESEVKKDTISVTSGKPGTP